MSLLTINKCFSRLAFYDKQQILRSNCQGSRMQFNFLMVYPPTRKYWKAQNEVPICFEFASDVWKETFMSELQSNTC